MFSSPFSPLAEGSGLKTKPSLGESLRQPLADLYGVPAEQLIPVRGALHGLEVVLRRIRQHGYTAFSSPDLPELNHLADIYSLERKTRFAKGCGAHIELSPRLPDGKVLTYAEVRALCANLFPAWVVVDERLIDGADTPSLAAMTKAEANLVIVRDMSLAYGLDSAPLGALISFPKTIERLETFVEPNAFSGQLLDLAVSALSDARVLPLEARLLSLKAERERVRPVLETSDLLDAYRLGEGPFVWLCPKDLNALRVRLTRLGLGPQDYEGPVPLESHESKEHPRQKGLIVRLASKADADRLLLALNSHAPEALSPRRAEVVRDTKETKISVVVDLDAQGPVKAKTGNGFFDHMLEQVGTHGGFSLIVGCEGDHHIDPHHSIEDVMLALGKALKDALGDRLGLSRFGFVLPMDETLAEVAIDLGGRPFAQFDGTFAQTLIGDYPTQMTAHAFRSLAETLSAAIHVKVSGENDHHKTEACFKALGRALRMALKRDGDALPSTKGVLA